MSELNDVSTKKKSIEELVAEHKRKAPLVWSLDQAVAKEQTRWFLDHAFMKFTYDDLMMFVTIFVLFGDDLKVLGFSKQADSSFIFLTSFAFILFLLEMILYIWAKSEILPAPAGRSMPYVVEGYFLGFFFWLDFLAILSMIFDLPWLQVLFGIREGMKALLSSSQAGAAGKIGAKAGRVVRMVRLVRLVKLYKITSQRRREKKMLEDIETLVEQGRMDEEEIDRYFNKMQHQKQSKVGAELSDSITRRVIAIVLMLLVTVPFLTNEEMNPCYNPATEYMQKITANLQLDINNTTRKRSVDCEQFVQATKSFLFTEPLFLKVSPNPMPYCGSYDIGDFSLEGMLLGKEVLTNTNNLTSSNELSVVLDEAWYDLRNPALGVDAITTEVILEAFPLEDDLVEGSATFEAHFNDSDMTDATALASTLLTCFVILILIGMSSSFQNVTQELVLAPIEQMMEMVRYVAEDPLEDFEFEETGQYETKVIQLAIQKITTLLRVGFGIAGAEIISMNMRMDEGRGGSALDPMIPGKRMYAIFGFCDIHEFDMCTEKLKDEIMR